MKSILNLPNDSTAKTIIVALALCLVCSIIVSSAAVGLKPKQIENKSKDVKQNILEVAGLMKPDADVDALFENIEALIVDLETGSYNNDIDALNYDQRKAAKDPSMNLVLTAEQDLAKIKRRAKQATVYHVKENGKTKLLILPVHGYGLWSTMYGFLALESDGKTVYGIKFYEHGETPGLGGEIDNPKWRSLWPGKLLYDSNGDVALSVSRTPGNEASRVDGLAGATLTGNGVHNLIQYWLGQNGFGPYLKKFVAENS